MAALPIAVTIMPPTGTPYSFHGWTGWVDGISISVDRDMRVGQSGSVAQGIGKRSADSKCTAYKFLLTKALMVAFCDLIENASSPTPCKMVDAYGRSYNVRVVDTLCDVAACKGPVDGTTQTAYKVSVSITVERLP